MGYIKSASLQSARAALKPLRGPEGHIWSVSAGSSRAASRGLEGRMRPAGRYFDTAGLTRLLSSCQCSLDEGVSRLAMQLKKMTNAFYLINQGSGVENILSHERGK